MAVKAISGSDKDQELIIDTLKHARRQEYTPQRLCELQKIIETQYYYWWIMDMKKEEFCLELFDEDFQYYYNGYLASTKPEEQARTSKWVNAPLATMHMGHQPLVWLMEAGCQKSGIHVIFKKGDRMNLRGDIILSFTILFHIIM